MAPKSVLGLRKRQIHTGGSLFILLVKSTLFRMNTNWSLLGVLGVRLNTSCKFSFVQHTHTQHTYMYLRVYTPLHTH